MKIDLSVLKAKIPESYERSEKAKVKKQRRKVRKKKKTCNEGKIPDFDSCRQIPEKKVTWYNVKAWFKEGIEKRISWSVTPGEWGGKQSMLATKLLKAYDGELVKKAIFYLCDNWEEMVKHSNGKLTGLPTVELLWGGRERIFPHVERGLPYKPPSERKKREKKDLDEYVEPSPENIGHGW